MRGKYIIIARLAVAYGAGAATWYAASQIGLRIEPATHLAAMAQSAAEEKAKAAELALGVSEAAERFAQAELSRERKTREAAEQAFDMAVIRTAQAVTVLADKRDMTKVFEGNSPSAEKDGQITREELILTLAAQGTTKKSLESKLNDLDTILLSLDEMIANQVAARRQAQTELENTRLQLQWQQATTTKLSTTSTARRIVSTPTPRRSQTWWQCALPNL